MGLPVLVACLLANPAAQATQIPMPKRLAPELIGRYDWTGTSIPTNGHAQPGFGEFDSAMMKYLRYVGAPGGGLTVYYKGHKLYSKGFGYADVDAKIPFKPSTPTRISSVSKYLTKSAIEALIAQGKLHSDDRVIDILRKGSVVPLVAGEKTADGRVSQITVQQLLDHKSGIEAGLDISECTKDSVVRLMKFTKPISAENALGYVLGRPLKSDPGTKDLYSNYGYALLGKIIQIVSGQSYEQFVRSNVLLPGSDPKKWFITTAQRKDKRAGEAEYYSSSPHRTWNAFRWDILAGAGGWVVPVDGLAELFARKFPGPGWDLTYFGSYTGAVTVMKVHKNSLTFAASINFRRGNDANDNDVLFAALEKATEHLKFP